MYTMAHRLLYSYQPYHPGAQQWRISDQRPPDRLFRLGPRVTETVAAIVAAHRAGTLSPAQTVARSFARIRDHDDPAIFISLRD
jgi:predicted component of type VI protein secretion system